jgi:hypothetical protein
VLFHDPRSSDDILDGRTAHAGSCGDYGALPLDREESVHDLLDTLKQCVERVDRYRRPSQRVGESNTKAGLIQPVIATLGWDVLDPDEVHREYRRRPADNPVDYALLLRRTPRLFIVAKGRGENSTTPSGPTRPSATPRWPGSSGWR